MNKSMLHDIAALNVPVKPPEIDTFFDIISQGQKETSITKAYAYFLNPKNNRDIATLFYDCLMTVVERKLNEGQVRFKNWECKTEYPTPKGNRIDLVLINNDEKEKGCILIENKIFHHLHNDLDDYWNCLEAKHKTGIVLTLHKEKNILCPYFINITHDEWIKEIERTRLPLNLDIKQSIYVNDFIQNMKKIKQHTEMNERVEFFFANKEKINNAVKIADEAASYVVGQLKIVSEHLGYNSSDIDGWYVEIWKPNQEIFYSIVYDSILESESSIEINIELYKSANALANTFKELTSDLIDKYKLSYIGKIEKGVTWFVTKKYSGFSINEIENLSDFVLDKIKTDFEPVFNKMLEHQQSLQQQN